MLNFFLSLKDNAVFAGLFGTMLMGSIMYMLKATPKKIWEWLFRAFTVKLTVTNDDEVFSWINEWLGAHTYARKARTLRITPKPGDDRQWTIAPGVGNHYLWDGGPIVVNREIDKENSGKRSKDRETFTIWTFSRNQGQIRRLIDRARAKRNEDAMTKMQIKTWTSWWGWQPCPINKSKRDISTVFLPEAQKKDILDDIKWFLENGQWFKDRGIPYRQGYLFYGPPGTGKTTLISTLAGYFNRTVCILNLATIANDEDLMDAFRRVPADAILLIEDIDCVKVSKKRKEAEAAKSTKKKGAKGKKVAPPPEKDDDDDENKLRITLSGLLNAIDGVATSEGYILCMTTNHIDQLDPALIREGRVNKKIEVGLMEPSVVMQMVDKFFPGRQDVRALVQKEVSENVAKSPAFWQARLMNIHAQERTVNLLEKN